LQHLHGICHVPQGQGHCTRDLYNPDDPPEAYTNTSVYTRLTNYTEAARSVHGPNFDLATLDLDRSLVMRVGGGKKHGRYWLGDGVIGAASTPSLS
jgi:hypothetical protein